MLIVVVVIRRDRFVMELTGNLYKLCLRTILIMRIGDKAQHDEEENLPCMAVKQMARKTKTLRVYVNRKRIRRIKAKKRIARKKRRR